MTLPGMGFRAPTIVCYLLATLLLGVCSGCGGFGGGDGVVSLAPNITETIFAIGKGNEVIGVSDFDDFPRQVERLPQLGGYIDPDLEQIALLQPQLILVPGQHEKVTTFAEQNGINVLNVHMDSLATIDAGIESIGVALHAEDRATQLRSEITATLDKIRDAVAPFERPKVFIVMGRERGDLSNLQTVGGTSFISELVSIAGGDNIYADSDNPYFEASKETLLLRAPDVILEIHAGRTFTENQMTSLLSDWRMLESLPAWKEKRIYFFTDSLMMRPGPRITEIAMQIAAKLHFDAQLPR